MNRILSALFVTTLWFTGSYAHAEGIEVQTKGMVCDHCSKRVTKQIMKNESVEKVDVDLENQKVFITVKKEHVLSDEALNVAFKKAELPVEKIERLP